MAWVALPSVEGLVRAGVNVRDGFVGGGLADLRRMPRTVVDEAPNGTLYRYAPAGPSREHGAPILLVPPLGAPDFAFDLRRGCSLVEHLVGSGRRVYLVDYGRVSAESGTLGMEFWVDEVLPRAIERASADSGTAQDVCVVGWCLGGIFSLLAAAAHPELPVRSVAAIASPFDISTVPLYAPLRPVVRVATSWPLAGLYQGLGSVPAPVVKWAFQLSSIDKYLSKPLTIARLLDDRDGLAQIEAVEHLMDNMIAYPGRVLGQLYRLMARTTDLADGDLEVAGRRVRLAAVEVPVLLVGSECDVLAPLDAVRRAAELLTGSPRVCFEPAPGGHLGVLTGRRARANTWRHLDDFLDARQGNVAKPSEGPKVGPAPTGPIE